MRKNAGPRGAGVGVGYVTVMIVFATICLTIFAVLSFRAATSDDALNARGGKYLNQYYAADAKAKEILSELCDIAEDSRQSGFFFDTFEETAAEMDGVTVKSDPRGCTAFYSVKIDDKRELCAEIVFYEEKSGFEIKSWKNVTAGSSEKDEGLHVWDGTSF